MEPIYTPHNTNPAYQLNWGLTLFWRAGPIPSEVWFGKLQESTEPDGVRIIKHRLTTGQASQFFVSTKPHVTPAELIRSVKGRLQYIFRSDDPKAFQRNYSLRSIGSATRAVVENYVASQLEHHQMADSRIQGRLASFQKCYPHVDLSRPSISSHGQFWYNLHIVIVTELRDMMVQEKVLRRLNSVVEAAALKHRHTLSRLALLGDHIHMTMGCPIVQSPETVASGYLNNCAYACGMKPVFQFGYYVGTIGEYDRGAVVQLPNRGPPAQGRWRITVGQGSVSCQTESHWHKASGEIALRYA
jgi:REP element-mobilizing transposase RayT